MDGEGLAQVFQHLLLYLELGSFPAYSLFLFDSQLPDVLPFSRDQVSCGLSVCLGRKRSQKASHLTHIFPHHSLGW